MMIHALVLLGLSSVTSATESNKLLDGGAAYCASADDVGRTAYQLKSAAVRKTDAEEWVLDVRLSFMICGRDQQWLPRDPWDSVRSQDREGQAVTYHFDQPRLNVFRAGANFHRDEAVGHEAEQAFSVALKPEQILTAQELARFQSGEAIPVVFEVYTASQQTVERADGSRLPLGRRASGGYSVSFKASRHE